MVGGPLNDLIVVAGDVSLGGKLNVALSPGGSLMSAYRVISYGGTLSNAAGLTLARCRPGPIAPTTSSRPRWTSRSTLRTATA